MADRFEDLGIAPELVAGVEAVGWEVPGGLQREALPVIRRGNNVVLHASAGSGVVGAWGLGVLDRLIAEEPASAASPRVLVLVPDSDTASLTADSLAGLAEPAGVTVRAQDAGWADRPVDILVLSPMAAAAAVRESTLKLEGVVALVVAGADQLEATGQWEDLETMADIAPAGAQRVLVTGTLGGRIDGFAERHVRKAMTIPPRPALEETASTTGSLRYRVVPEHGKVPALAALVPSVDAPEVAVVCRTRDRADTLERALAARGVLRPDGSGLRILVLPHNEADQRSTKA
ncbi:MAG: DEAD/DEAH box helicase, partial [Gemmatimonadota bacterium]